MHVKCILSNPFAIIKTILIGPPKITVEFGLIKVLLQPKLSNNSSAQPKPARVGAIAPVPPTRGSNSRQRFQKPSVCNSIIYTSTIKFALAVPSLFLGSFVCLFAEITSMFHVSLPVAVSIICPNAKRAYSYMYLFMFV